MSSSAPFDHTRWHSPLSYRYGSKAMRSLWSEHEKRKTWRWVWVALAEAQAELGLFDKSLVDDLREHQTDIDVEAAEALEVELKHDLVAELRIFATQCPKGGRILHLGATSMDIEDNADVLRLHVGLGLLRHTLGALLTSLAGLVENYADHATMGFTHLQPAEPTTLGYRFAQWAQDLLEDWLTLGEVRDNLRCKGFKGAVGTSAR
jgi:adenylosuccinate lyase